MFPLKKLYSESFSFGEIGLERNEKFENMKERKQTVAQNETNL